MDVKKTQGYQDQEILLEALIKYASQQTHRSERIIRGMVRQSISQWSQSHNISLKEIKHQDEASRLKIVSEIIDIFIEKITHIIESKSLRERLKKNILQIYLHWKSTRRVDPSEELIDEFNELVSQQ